LSKAKSGVGDENSILNPPTALKNLIPNNPKSAIIHKIAKIDKFGRISIPAKMREALCLNESTAVYIIDRDDELIIRPIHTKTPDAVKKISKMNLPVDDWETMEQEIESGAVNE
jgi:AbrB family looped-hinge helix DNA binding protein